MIDIVMKKSEEPIMFFEMCGFKKKPFDMGEVKTFISSLAYA